MYMYMYGDNFVGWCKEDTKTLCAGVWDWREGDRDLKSLTVSIVKTILHRNI